MKLATLLFLSCVGSALISTEACGDSYVEFDYNVSSNTRNRATVFVQVYDDRPNTTANFLKYVNGGLLNFSLMHELVVASGTPIAIYGGGYYPQYTSNPARDLGQSLNPNFTVDLDRDYATANPTVNSEVDVPPPHFNLRGTISMRLYGNPPEPNSASNQYFFNLQDNTLADQNEVTSFGKVAGDGMTLIDAYSHALPIHNLNPGTDTTTAGGPFTSVPVFIGSTSFIPLSVVQAKVVDYYGSGPTTTVPASGLTFANKDAFIDTGAQFSGTGNLVVGVGRILQVREGVSIPRPVENHGTLAPGLSIGQITINNDYYNWSDGTLAIQLAGTTVDTQYDKLVTSGLAYLAGKLQVSTLNGFTPALGSTFTILSAADFVGRFTSYTLPTLASGQAWKLTQTTTLTATSLNLTVVAGDYDRNGVIDASDYVVWRKMRNNSVTAWSGADGNGDGLINDADLTIWRTNLGAFGGGVHAAGASASGLMISSVPEPMTGTLIVMAALLTSCSARHRVKRISGQYFRQ